MPFKKKPSAERFAELATKTGGNISAIAQSLNVSRQAVAQWIDKDPEFRAAIEDARESSLDLTEDRMMMLIQGIAVKNSDDEIIGWQERPDAGLIKFKLATHGKSRGYAEEMKVALEDKRPRPTIILPGGAILEL